jgi:hypothetical protein
VREDNSAKESCVTPFFFFLRLLHHRYLDNPINFELSVVLIEESTFYSTRLDFRVIGKSLKTTTDSCDIIGAPSIKIQGSDRSLDIDNATIIRRKSPSKVTIDSSFLDNPAPPDSSQSSKR